MLKIGAVVLTISAGFNLLLAVAILVAIIFNSAVFSFCLLSIFVIWAASSHGHKWAFWALLITMGLSQILAFIADSFIGNKILVVNIVLTAIYLFGVVLSWVGLRAN